jgi:tellurite resistance protein TehA-like permease
MPSVHSKDASQRAAFSRLAAAIPGGGFAFVMATGIVAIDAASQGLRPIGAGLFAINLVAFAVLALMMLLRLTHDRAALISELSQHRTAAGFLTIIAAAAVLGEEFAVQASELPIGAGLWLTACGLWVGLVYAFFAVLATRPEKTSLADGLDGSWLLVAVATEALTVLGTHVAGGFARPDIVLWLSLCWFLLGGFFYLIIIALILYRWLFEPLPPEALTPPYWINMGAMAIATLAGARLESIAGSDPLLTALQPDVAFVTMLCWAVATWWIPLLLLMMIWRHAVRGVPLSYRFEYWSMVFPLGMYTAATSAFARVNSLDFLSWIPRVVIWIALGAWTASFAGMLHRAVGRP